MADHNALVLQDRDRLSILTWGRNFEGQLGHSHESGCVPVPTLVSLASVALEIDTVMAVACGYNHTLLLCRCKGPDLDVPGNHVVIGWGSNQRGQIHGIGTQGQQLTPAPVEFLLRRQVVGIACGYHHSVALTVAAFTRRLELLAWGNNLNYELAGTPRKGERFVRVQFPSDRILQMLSVGCHHTLALFASPAGTTEVLAWGRNNEGQLGRGDAAFDACPTPAVVQTLQGKQVIAVACGACHSVALCEGSNGTERCVLAWGWLDGRPLPTPVQLPVPTGFRILSVFCGHYYTAAVAAPSTDSSALGTAVLCWPDRGHETYPVSMPLPCDAHVLGIWGGLYHSIVAVGQSDARTEPAAVQLFGWGNNNFGQRGGGSATALAPDRMIKIAIPPGSPSSLRLPSGLIDLAEVQRESSFRDFSRTDLCSTWRDLALQIEQTSDVVQAVTTEFLSLAASRRRPTEPTSPLSPQSAEEHAVLWNRLLLAVRDHRSALHTWATTSDAESSLEQVRRELVTLASAANKAVQEARLDTSRAEQQGAAAREQLVVARQRLHELEEQVQAQARVVQTLELDLPGWQARLSGTRDDEQAVRHLQDYTDQLAKELQLRVEVPCRERLAELEREEVAFTSKLVGATQLWAECLEGDNSAQELGSERLFLHFDALHAMGIFIPRHGTNRLHTLFDSMGAEYLDVVVPEAKCRWQLADALRSVRRFAQTIGRPFNVRTAERVESKARSLANVNQAVGAVHWLLTHSNWLLKEVNRALIEDNGPHLQLLARFLSVALSPLAAPAPRHVFCVASFVSEDELRTALRSYGEAVTAASCFTWRGFVPVVGVLEFKAKEAFRAGSVDLLFKIEFPEGMAGYADLSAPGLSDSPAEVQGFVLPGTCLQCTTVLHPDSQTGEHGAVCVVLEVVPEKNLHS